MLPRPKKGRSGKREDVKLRTVDPKTGRSSVTLDVRNISPEMRRKLVGGYTKAARNVVPEAAVEAEFSDSSSKPKKGTSTRASVSMSSISAKNWERTFGKKKSKKPN